MATKCDNKSVGVIFRENDQILIIKRLNYPVSYAFVAGHLDGDTPEVAARKESDEEVNLTATSLNLLLEERFDNPCKREGGSFHEWHLFEATKWTGTAVAGSDAKKDSTEWISKTELQELADKTLAYESILGVSIESIHDFTVAITQNEQWTSDPGLEPIWILLLRQAKIL